MATRVYGDAEYGIGKPQEAFKSVTKTTKGNMVVASVEGREKPVETKWIKSCAEEYHISDDISDYIIVPIPIVTVGIPNRNLQAFDLKDITKWNTDAGRITYQTFIGKPLFRDHKNDNPKEAKGVILDSVMKYIPRYDLWKIIILSAWCRTKDREVANHILKDPKSEYSMGALVNKFIEYPTGKVVNPNAKGGHKRGYLTKDGDLVYELMTGGVNFFETSIILTDNGAADNTATNRQEDILIRPGDLVSSDY